jgi:PAS domain S-box-containing protein
MIVTEQQLYDNLPCGYFSSSPNGFITECNTAFLLLTGYQKDEVINVKRIQDLLTSSGKKEMETHYTPLLQAKGLAKEISLEFVCKDGSKFPVLINALQIKDDSNNHSLTHYTVFDFTQLNKYETELLSAKTKSDELLADLLQTNKELEKKSTLANEQKEQLEKLNLFLQAKNQQLFDSEIKFKTLFESSQGLLSTHDLQGNLLSVNDAFADSLGYTKEEILKLGLFGTTLEENHQRVRNYLTAIQNIGDTKGQVIAKHKNGSEIIWMYSAVLAKNAYGEAYVIGNALDITELKRAEAERENRQNLLIKRQVILNKITKTPFIESKNYQENLRSITKLASEGMEVERASVWHYTDKGILCIDLFERAKDSHSSGAELLAKDYPNYFIGIGLNEPISAADAFLHKYTLEFAESYLRPLDIVSMLDVPIRVNGELIGILCFESVKIKRNWDEDDINFARSISDTVSLVYKTNDANLYLAELKHTKALLEETNNVAKIGGWEFDVANQKLFWTKQVKEINGFSDDYEPDLYKGINHFKEGASRDTAQRVLKEAMAEGRGADIELQTTTQQGKEIWVRIIVNAEMENGVCKKIYGTFQDIDYKKKAELEISRSKKLLEDVLRAASEVSIVATNSGGIITVFNKGAEKIFGNAAEDMIGQSALTVFRHAKEEIAKREIELREKFGYPIEGFPLFVKIAEIEGSEIREWTYFRKDGTPITLETMITTIKDENDVITGYLAVSTNISKLKEANSSLEILSDNLQKKNQQLLNFAHITSHNLRSPVSNLNSLLGFYKDSISVEDKELLFTKFEKVIHHLSETLNELIESLKIQEDVGKRLELLSFEQIFTKTKEILAGQIMETNAIITSDFSEVDKIEYPQSYMESIILNLSSNAIKYRSADRIPKLHFQTKKSNEGIILTATDNGRGIDLEKHGHKLFGLNKTFHKHAEAKGVGLFITKTQVEAMGGRISAESEVNKGTTFKIVFKNKS